MAWTRPQSVVALGFIGVLCVVSTETLVAPLLSPWLAGFPHWMRWIVAFILSFSALELLLFGLGAFALRIRRRHECNKRRVDL